MLPTTDPFTRLVGLDILRFRENTKQLKSFEANTIRYYLTLNFLRCSLSQRQILIFVQGKQSENGTECSTAKCVECNIVHEEIRRGTKCQQLEQDFFFLRKKEIKLARRLSANLTRHLTCRYILALRTSCCHRILSTHILMQRTGCI